MGRFLAFVGLALLGGLAFALVRSQALPEGPEPVAWDREACAHCHMHVGEPSFAAQLQTRDGRVHNFDDPGCLLAYLERHEPDVHAIYFRHVREDRWIPAERAAFVEVTPTPMGYGIGAVDAGTPASFGRAEALVRVARAEAR